MKDSLKLYLVMLVKLVRNKLLLFLIIILCSCSIISPKKVYYTELVCPDKVVLIRFANAKEVRRAVEDALFEKKKYETNVDFTVMKFAGNRSFVIENVPPEDAVKCDIKQIPTKLRFKYYEKYYH